MCASLSQGGGGSCLFLEIIRPILVLFVHINILFGCVVFIPSYVLNKSRRFDRIVNVSTRRRYSDDEIDRLFGYFEDGMKTAKISK